jgi:hypothetical protein
MRFARVLITVSSIAASTIASAQDDRLPVLRPQVEIVKASPSPFPFTDKQPSDYDTWIRTPWVQMNRALCGNECILVSLITNVGQVKVDVGSAKKGLAKLRLGVAVPPSCGDAVWYGEMRDQFAVGSGLTDPSPRPIDRARIHLFRYDQNAREISMVFQNEDPANARQARLNVLCKSKP